MEVEMKITKKELKKLIESAFDRRVTGPQSSGGPSSHQMFLDREEGRSYSESDQKFIDECKTWASYIAELYEAKYPVGRGEGKSLEEIRVELVEEEISAEEIAGTIEVFEDLIGVLRSMSMGE